MTPTGTTFHVAHFIKVQWPIAILTAVLAALLPAVPLQAFAADAGKDASQQAETARLTARKVFEDLPLSVLEILSKSKRLDMLDYYDADSLWQATNNLGGPSVLETVSPDYLSVRLTGVSTLQIRILPRKKQTEPPLVMTLYTVGAGSEAPDTQVSFFTADLKPLETGRFFKEPKLTDFFSIPKKSGVKMKDIEEAVPFPTISYSTGTSSPAILTGKLTVEAYLSKEAQALTQPCLRPALQWQWNGNAFIPLKPKTQ